MRTWRFYVLCLSFFINASASEAGLIVTAKAEDGIVEAFESTDGRIFGFQFHPEDMQTDFSRLLLKNLMQKTKSHPCLDVLKSPL